MQGFKYLRLCCCFISPPHTAAAPEIEWTRTYSCSAFLVVSHVPSRTAPRVVNGIQSGPKPIRL